MPRFVLEIGTEEMPPRFFPPAMGQLRADGERMLERARLSFGELKVYGTPRRLVLVAENLAERQAPHTREERGPAAKVAFDAEGRPTKAAVGFAKRFGLTPEQLERRQTDQGDYVFAIIQESELPAREALAKLLPDLITGLSFPKTMRWGKGKLRFGRPIRWLLALVDGDVVEFELEGVKSGRLTRGHPVLADGMHLVFSAENYEALLGEKFILVNPSQRRLQIRRLVERVAAGEDARIVFDDLLDETTYLVEWPTAACGRFDPAFLSLPRPILIDEMQHVQSYFPLEDAQGKLLPAFIAVRDGGGDHLDVVIRGWENVLRAKLIDASFFYQQDLKTPLADRVEALRGVVFHERLGTVYEKVERIRAAAAAAAEQIGLPDADRHALDRAALLCKADLTTEVVAELTNLQGAMGREYALASDEPAQVAEAIGEHYRPRFAGDSTPATQMGQLLALADKLDTLASLFAAGVVPSGSADPFGLRREAYGVVSIVTGSGISLSVSVVMGAALSVLRGHVEFDRPTEDTVTAVQDFLRDRLAVSLREEDIRYDLVDAALAVGVDDIRQTTDRARALRELSGSYDFLPTVIACTRPMNILKGFEGGEVDPSLLTHDSEKRLWEIYREVVCEAESAELIQLFCLFTERLREPIDHYFDDVLVMAEDESLRRNRLAMCWQLSQLFRRLADFTLIVQV